MSEMNEEDLRQQCERLREMEFEWFDHRESVYPDELWEKTRASRVLTAIRKAHDAVLAYQRSDMPAES